MAYKKNNFHHRQYLGHIMKQSHVIYKGIQLVLGSVTVMMIAACSTPLTSNHYTRNDVRMVQDVDYGRVIGLREVIIDGTNSGQGAATGALMGGLGGSTLGTGNANILTTAGGALLGSVAGGGLEEMVTRVQGVELIVELNSGRRIAVVQEGRVSFFSVGQKVRVMSIGGSARVTPDENV